MITNDCLKTLWGIFSTVFYMLRKEDTLTSLDDLLVLVAFIGVGN